MLYVDGWDGMVIIVHRSSKSTFGANKCYDHVGIFKLLSGLLATCLILKSKCKCTIHADFQLKGPLFNIDGEM